MYFVFDMYSSDLVRSTPYGVLITKYAHDNQC